MKQAVCVLIEIPNTKMFLAVSRRGSNTQWGLPGGKVDPGETPLEAVVRETKEETGIDLDKDKLKEVYVGVCTGDVVYLVTTYKYDGTFSTDSLETEPGMLLSYRTEAELCDDSKSPFAEYNRRIFKYYQQVTNGLDWTKSPRLLASVIELPDGTFLQSKHRHDYVTAVVNGNFYMLDGGTDYQRASLNGPFIDRSVYVGDPHEKAREWVVWGTRGKDGKSSLTWIKIKDMTTEHILACLDTHRGIINHGIFDVMENELLWRENNGR